MSVTNDELGAAAPHPPVGSPHGIQIDCAVGLQGMPDGSTTVSLGWSVAGWAMTTVLLPLDGAVQLADQIKEAVHKAHNPIISGPGVAHLIGRIPRNEH